MCVCFPLPPKIFVYTYNLNACKIYPESPQQHNIYIFFTYILQKYFTIKKIQLTMHFSGMLFYSHVRRHKSTHKHTFFDALALHFTDSHINCDFFFRMLVFQCYDLYIMYMCVVCVPRNVSMWAFIFLRHNVYFR